MRVSAKGGTPEKLIDGGGLARPRILPGGEAVLFAVGGASGGIAVQSLKTGQRKILLPGTAPSYLPTGHLVFERSGILFGVLFDPRTLEMSGAQVALVNEVRSSPAQYAVSDSGTLVYVPPTSAAARVNGVLTWVDLSSGTKTPLPLPPRQYLHPRLSPDGTRLAVQTREPSGQSDIWIYYLDGKTQMQQLAGKGNNSHPMWTRDSKRLTFTSDRDGTESIWQQLADGSAPAEQLTRAETGLPHWPDSWSPDGKILAFTKYRQGEQHVWVLPVDRKSEPTMIVGGTANQQAGGADFSPDGQWIAYRSNENGPHVQVQRFPTTGTFYDIAGKGGAYPVWASQQRLIYRRNVAAVNVAEALPGELVTVDVTTNPSLRFGSERTLATAGILIFFGSRDYDIPTNGNRLIGIFPENLERAAAAPRPQINLVLNWVEELKRRVSTP